MPTSRISKEAAERFGLFAIIETKRVILPLKGVACEFSVLSDMAEVSMTQIFRQENEKPLDCEYLFPLPADASVYSCEADINGRTIRAQVREREEARQIAAEKKAAGFRTALVESERDNLFTLSLGNVQPGDLIVVQLKYFQTLRSLAETRSVEIPFCPGFRYIPGKPLLRTNKGKGVVDDTDEVPDASRITPVRIDAEHPDAAYVEVRGTLDGRFVKEQSLASPSHPVVVQREGEELQVALSDKGEVPDRDFVLRWSEREPEELTPRVWIREKGDEAYALLEIRAPQNAPDRRAPVDFYFLVDRSGSMRGQKWNKAVEALQCCIKVLGAEDRGMVTFFDSRFQDFAERPLPPQQLLDDKQFQALKRLGTGGGTEMRPALRHVLEIGAQHSRDRQKNLILITDAQLGNESGIRELMKGAPDFPVHCFGIDVALNDSLLLALARQQGGTFHSLNPNDNIPQIVTALGKTLGQPVLLDLQVSDGWELADARIPNLYAGQIHYVSAKSTTGKPLELAGRGPSSESVRIQFERQSATVEAPHLHWCKSRIQRLIAEGDNKGAIALSVKSNLICVLTAFVAWDDAEKVAVASHHLVQPSLESSNVRYYHRQMLVPPATAAGQVIASISKGRLFEESSDAEYEEAVPLQEPMLHAEQEPERESADISNRMRLLAVICDRIGAPDCKPLLKAIHDWVAEATGAERLGRIEALDRLIHAINIQFARIDALRQILIDEATGAERLQKIKRLDRFVREIKLYLARIDALRQEIETHEKQIRQRLKSFVEKSPA
jgi:Ca-activated chloride channel homolog